MKLKIPAFTILEMMIGMLISSIVIVMVYTALMIFNSQWQGYQLKSNKRSEFLLFNKVIEKDFLNADAISDSAENWVLNIYFGPKNRIQYRFEDAFILRTAWEKSDTFYLKASIKIIRYQDDNIKLVRSVSGSVVLNKVEIPFILDKIYTAQELMKIKPGE